MPRNRVYRRPDSEFWWAEYTTPEGQPRRQSTGRRRKEEAVVWLAARDRERFHAGVGLPTAKAVSLVDAVSEYIAARAPRWSKGWAATVEGLITRQVLPHFGPDTILSTITRPQVEAFQATQLGRPAVIRSRGKPARLSLTHKIGAASTNRLMAALAAFGQWAAEPDRGYLLANPFAKHKPFAEDQRPPPKLDERELARFLSKLPEERRYLKAVYYPRATLTVAVETGLRKSELERLRREDVDTTERRLWVVSSWSRGLNKGKRTRSVALSEACLAALESIPPRADGLVLGPLGDWRRTLRSAAQEAGIGSAWFHAARHWGATRAGEAGATLKEMMEWGGWVSPRMVSRYTHADHRRMLALVDRIGRVKNVRNSPAPAGKDRIPRRRRTA